MFPGGARDIRSHCLPVLPAARAAHLKSGDGFGAFFVQTDFDGTATCLTRYANGNGNSAGAKIDSVEFNEISVFNISDVLSAFLAGFRLHSLLLIKKFGFNPGKGIDALNFVHESGSHHITFFDSADLLHTFAVEGPPVK